MSICSSPISFLSHSPEDTGFSMTPNQQENLFIAFIVIAVLFAICVYFLPTFIAKMRGHTQTKKIFVTNFLFGWTGVGLIGCVVWACSNFEKEKPIPPKWKVFR